MRHSDLKEILIDLNITKRCQNSRQDLMNTKDGGQAGESKKIKN